MQMISLIPFVTLLVSVVFAAVSLAWNSSRRETAAMTAIFVCTGIWALLDLLASLESDPARAAFWIRWVHLPALMLGPCAIRLLGRILDPAGDRLQKGVYLGFAVALGLGGVAGTAPGALEGVVASVWGWMPRWGWLTIAIVPAGAIFPVVAAIQAVRVPLRDRMERGEARRGRAIWIAVGLSLAVGICTDYALPLLGLPAPRLGAGLTAVVSAAMWFQILHANDDLAVTPHGMARAMLAELRDGVMLADLDGTVLASNHRIAEMTGWSSSRLAGASLVELVDTPFDRIREGLQDRESTLTAEDGDGKPISLSSFLARDRHGSAVGVILVFRDRRAVQLLRRRLLTSGRLAAIGELAAGIAHEVNNPIAFIRSDLNLLSERLREVHARAAKKSGLECEMRIFEAVGERITTSLTSIERVAQIVADVKGFAHAGGPGQGGSDPVALVEGAMRLARLFRGEEVELRLADSGFVERIECGQELKQVLLALFRLLVEGSQAGGSVCVGLASEAGVLHTILVADRLAEEASQLVARFDAIEAADVWAAPSEFGLVIATELVEQLGGVFSFMPRGPHAIELRLQLPIDSGVSG
ncbi:MAG: hypothetical protein CL908_17585 [Deltaproteobacteria bacterium]|nr:hypothetical protein [Deltaproteobacteria bacterium]